MGLRRAVTDVNFSGTREQITSTACPNDAHAFEISERSQLHRENIVTSKILTRRAGVQGRMHTNNRSTDDSTSNTEATKAMRRAQRLRARRRKACRELGIPERDGYIYSAAPAAEAMGISVGMLRKHVEPADYTDNPYYRHAGAPVGLYDPIDLHKSLKKPAIKKAKERYAARKAAAEKAIETRMRNMVERMENAEITIIASKTDEEIRRVARNTHGGNYLGDPGLFVWSNRTARNCIRHNLTNYEALWAICNRGYTGEEAYEVLRERVDQLVNETYPQYAEDEAEEAAE